MIFADPRTTGQYPRRDPVNLHAGGVSGPAAPGTRPAMARTETFVPAPASAVWTVLCDPASYGYWVVGSKEVREADGAWPEPGSRFHHTVGFGPITVKDHTVSEHSAPERRLELKAKARPLGTAKVTLELIPEGNGTRVVMTEDPGDTLTALVFNPITHVLVRGRNEESLRRLGELAVRRT